LIDPVLYSAFAMERYILLNRTVSEKTMDATAQTCFDLGSSGSRNLNF
jgi:hypothetical protein